MLQETYNYDMLRSLGTLLLGILEVLVHLSETGGCSLLILLGLMRVAVAGLLSATNLQKLT